MAHRKAVQRDDRAFTPSIRRSAVSFHTHRSRGFALLITITLLAFLVLLLVSLASLTRVEVSVADNTQQLAQARQNALMALNIAIGQLQRHTGPDQRITAPADLRPLPVAATADPVSGQALEGAATDTLLNNVAGFWRAGRNPRWVGVWRDLNPERTGMDPFDPAPANPVPALQGWLVSGNEASGNTFVPESQVANFTLDGVTSPSAATATFGTADAPYRLLVGPGTTEIVDEAHLDRAVLAPQVRITSNAVDGLPGPQTVGHYAWWVGDEGIKARADLVDDYAASTDADENRTRLQSASRAAIEVMTGMEGVYPINHDDLAKVLSVSQLPQVPAAPAFREALASRYHDLTVHSRGVLADVRHGGLKADLSWMLGQSSEADFLDDLRALYANNEITLENPILGPVFTPYVAEPNTLNFINNFQVGLGRSATWAQLRSYFNMGNAPDALIPGVFDAGAARGRVQRVNTQGIGPLLVQAKVFFGLQVDADGAVHLRIRPLVVLANPYNIPLTGNYWVRFNRPSVRLYTGAFTEEDPPPVAPTQSDLGLFPNNNEIVYRTRMNLSLPDIEIPPGEARVYCLDKDYTDPGSGALQQIRMIAGYDDGPAFTLATNRSLSSHDPAHTHAALYINSGQAEARLYGADPATNAGTDDNLIQYVYGRPLNQAGVGGNFFVVYPTAAGDSREGGGCWFLIYDSLTTAPSISQQANFLQFNLRTLSSFYSANSGNTHPLENSQSYQRNGAPGNEAWFTADLMFDSDTGDLVRWGPVTKADASAPLGGNPPSGVSDATGFVNILYDLPRPGHPVASVPQLQHFSPSGFIANNRADAPTTEQYATQANTFQVNYPTGNSYPNPRLPRDRPLYAATTKVGSTNMGIAYDGSWLYNEVFADRFHFSTYPATDPHDFTTDRLINHRLRPFRPATKVAWNNPAHFRGAPRTAAANLLVTGSFNVNSTSREAWRAVLASLREVPVNGDTSTEVPFARTLFQTAGHAAARTGNSADAWSGFHNLTDEEIADLADEVVLQIRRRGPFLSFADFLNRRLVTAANDPLDLGLSGALQAAIDARFNQTSAVDPAFRVQSKTENFADLEYRTRTMTAGAPGYLLQADVLSPLAPALSVRSDTFTIRTYGDVHNPATGETTARAWCEAIVQRTPDYVQPESAGGVAPDAMPVPGSPNERFGRRYEIIGFRWLSANDI